MALSLLKTFGGPAEDVPKTRLQALMDFVDSRSRVLRRHPVFVLHYDEQAQNHSLSRDMDVEACKRYFMDTKDCSLTRTQVEDIRIVMNEHPDGILYEVLDELKIPYLEDWLAGKIISTQGNVHYVGWKPGHS